MGNHPLQVTALDEKRLARSVFIKTVFNLKRHNLNTNCLWVLKTIFYSKITTIQTHRNSSRSLAKICNKTKPKTVSRFTFLKAPIAAFFVAVFLPTIWFREEKSSFDEFNKIKPVKNLNGYTFHSKTESQHVFATLKTTNVLSGRYESSHDRFTVFIAEWPSNSGVPVTVFNHNPDECWIGQGAEKVEAWSTNKMAIQIGTNSVDFECRVFHFPSSKTMEMVVWKSFDGGCDKKQESKFQGWLTNWLHRYNKNRDDKLMCNYDRLISLILERRKPVGPMRLFRASTRTSQDWSEAYNRLKDFIPKWLEIDGASAN